MEVPPPLAWEVSRHQTHNLKHVSIKRSLTTELRLGSPLYLPRKGHALMRTPIKVPRSPKQQVNLKTSQKDLVKEHG